MALTTKTTKQQQLLAVLGICIIVALLVYMYMGEARSGFNEMESQIANLDQALSSVRDFKAKGCEAACQFRPSPPRVGLDSAKVAALEEFIVACQHSQQALEKLLVADEQYINSKWSGIPPGFTVLPWYAARYSTLQEGIRSRLASLKSESAGSSCSKR